MNVQYVTPLAAVIACWSASFAAPALRTNPPNRFVTAQVVTPHPDDARPTVCTEQYDPACARAGDVVKTYSNVCFARVAGATDITQGPCRKAALRRPQNDRCAGSHCLLTYVSALATLDVHPLI